MSIGFVGKLKWFLPVIIFLILLGVTVVWWAESSQGELPILATLPDFEMTTHHENSFRRSDLGGKINVINFIFTHCKSICPTTSQHMSELYRAFANTEKVQLISISVDPERDSLPVLAEYARNWGVTDNRWLFLRDTLEDIVDLSENGFMLPADNLPMGHTTRFTLVDHLGRIRAYYDGMDPLSVKIIKDHIRLLAGEMN